MCKDLQRIFDRKDGSSTFVPCRKCERCLDNRLNDLAGRAYAEALTSTRFVALTLTYADSMAVNSQVLVYKDVQLLIKNLRNDGFDVRYLVAGEYGSKRGRAHWHGIFYFRAEDTDALEAALKLPPADTECQHWPYWKHGYTFVQRPNYTGLRYALKYAVKDDGSEKTTRRSMMSKKPPLAAEYWRRMADMRVALCLPFSLEYTLPECRYKNGNAVRYWLSGASAFLAYQAHREAWFAAGNKTEPHVKAEHYEAVQKVILRGLNLKDGSRSRIQGIRDALPFYAHRDFDRSLVCGNGFLVRLTDGKIFYSEQTKEGARIWPVESLAEMIATARGRAVKPPLQPVKLYINRAPF